MTAFLRLILPLLLASALRLRAESPAPRVYRIMPVGDSITEGGATFSNYRYPLWEKLTAAGHLVEYVGSRQADSRIGPLAHEGQGGKNAEFLAEAVAASFPKHPADIVLLHAGHNHFAEEKPVPGIVAACESIIRTCRRTNPAVTVLLAQVIPSGKLPKYSYLPELNVALAGLAARLDTPGSRVILVNQAEGFDVDADTIGDHVHPNARGAEKMARRWFDALQQVLPPPLPMAVPQVVVYKKPGGPDLTLHIFRPAKTGPDDRPRPAILFFFGGGWKLGTPLQFYRECQFHAAHGRVAVSVDYRTASTHKTTPFESVADGKSAVRWVRQHAGELGVDPGRITVCGASAGGQVAAAAGLVPGLDDPAEDRSVSSKPNSMILLYPVLDNGPGGFGYEAVRDRYREISPLHNIREGAPPALILTGTKDTTAPLAMIREFKAGMEKAGARCDLELFEGAGHPIFEYRKGGGAQRERMLDLSLKFLDSLEGPQSRE